MMPTDTRRRTNPLRATTEHRATTERRRERKARVATAHRTRRKSSSIDLSSYDDAFLDCRGLNHPFEAVGYYRVGREIHRLLVCGRCATRATDRWSVSGARLARVYEYPDGYLITGQGKIDRSDIRLEVLNRVDIFGSEEEMVGAMFNGNGNRKRKK